MTTPKPQQRAPRDEVAERTVSLTEQIDSEVAQPIHHGVGVHVRACPGAGEQPRAVRAAARAEVRSAFEVCSEQFGEKGHIAGSLRNLERQASSDLDEVRWAVGLFEGYESNFACFVYGGAR